jgi:flagellar protein FlbD
MILLHRLAHRSEPIYVNPDLILMVEESPDTHVLLTNGTRYVVTETSEEIVQLVREWHVDILAHGLERKEALAA